MPWRQSWGLRVSIIHSVQFQFQFRLILFFIRIYISTKSTYSSLSRVISLSTPSINVVDYLYTLILCKCTFRGHFISITSMEYIYIHHTQYEYQPKYIYSINVYKYKRPATDCLKMESINNTYIPIYNYKGTWSFLNWNVQIHQLIPLEGKQYLVIGIDKATFLYGILFPAHSQLPMAQKRIDNTPDWPRGYARMNEA